MTNETELTTQTPAAALESDLADIRALLHEAVVLGKAAHESAHTQIAAMSAATRLFSVAAKGSEMVARLKGHVHETRHTTVVQSETIGPKDGQSYDEWWNSLSPEKQADLDHRFNEPWRKMRPVLIAEQKARQAADEAADIAYEATMKRLMAELGPPSEENPKTTSPSADDTDDPEAA